MGFQLLKSFFIKHKYAYLAGLLFMFLSSYIQTLSPRVLSDIIDLLKERNFEPRQIHLKVGLLLLITFATFAFTFLWRNLVIANARKLECKLREDLYHHFQSLSQSFYSRRKTGDLLAYCINDVMAVRMALGPATAMSINGIIICLSSIYFMFISINIKLTLLTLAPVPIIIVFMLTIGKRVQKRFRIVQEFFGQISDKVQDNISGIRVIKSYVQEDKEIKSFEALSEEMMEANVLMVKTSASLNPIIEACFSISFVFSLIIGGNMVLVDTISLGDFVAFNTYLTMIMAPVISIGRIINIFQRGMASLKRLNEIFNQQSEIMDEMTNEPEPIKGSIELKNLTFYYPGSKHPAIKDLSLTIHSGQMIGIIGRTGSGKTTIANLLMHLYNPQPGELFIDDRDILSLPLESVRNQISLVPQDTFLFSSSIQDNITSFKDIYSEMEVINSSKFSCIHQSILDFPDGFETTLGERGVNLSGGQKQRIAIARAVIREPAILILDDSLSAVDTITEKQILDYIHTYRKGKTTIIISHRVSAVLGCDKLIVLDDGKLCEQGTHDSLIKEKGIYYEIYSEQNKEKNN